MTKVIDDSAQRITSWEQKQIILSDGRVMAACWAYDYKTMSDLPNRYALSSDGGASYTAPIQTPLNGQTCTPVALADNRVLCIYRRLDKLGLWAHLAQIDGDTWTPLTEVPLWGTSVEGHSRESASMMEQMSSLKFGCPSVKQLANGDVFAIFWCVEDCVSNIRWFRIAVGD